MFYETAPFLLAAYLTVPFAADCWQGCTAPGVDARSPLASPQTTCGMKEKELLQLNFFKMYLPSNLFGIHKQAPLQMPGNYTHTYF